GLSKIKASAMLYMPDMHIGTFLGVNAFGYDSLNFYSTQHVNYQVKGNAEIIVKDESNEFRIESLKLNGEIQYRSDLNMSFQLLSEPLIDFTLTNLPDNVTLDLTAFSYPVENETIILTLSQDGFNISEHRISLLVDEAPGFEIKASSKISFRRTQWYWEDFPLDITNDMTNELMVHINVTAKETDLNYIRDLIVAGDSEEIR
ncbi:MAG: hypothetical protein ACTSP7_14070, partial [Candidatus Heimdallarchaeota archaeon]